MARRYLSYDEYADMGGKAVSEAAFPLLELKARKRIDRLTASRVQYMDVVPLSVRLCMCSLIDMENTVGIEAQAAKPVASSFSTDGYSESYGNGAYTADNVSKTLDQIVMATLYGEYDDHCVPLLYRGVR